jgi:BlaI family penicillinase repressor
MEPMAARARKHLELTDAEWKVMNAVWEHAPATARTVCDALAGSTGWAYTTVKTFMERLVEKGALVGRRQGASDVYSPVLPRTQARRNALRALLARAFGGGVAPLVHHLLGEERLSEGERGELRRLLEETERKGRAR